MVFVYKISSGFSIAYSFAGSKWYNPEINILTMDKIFKGAIILKDIANNLNNGNWKGIYIISTFIIIISLYAKEILKNIPVNVPEKIPNSNKNEINKSAITLIVIMQISLLGKIYIFR